MFVKFVNILHQRVGDMFNDLMMLCYVFFSRNHGTLRIMRSPKSNGNWRSLFKPREKTDPNLSFFGVSQLILMEVVHGWRCMKMAKLKTRQKLIFQSLPQFWRYITSWWWMKNMFVWYMCLGLVGHVQVIKLRQFFKKFGIEEMRKCLLKCVYAQR